VALANENAGVMDTLGQAQFIHLRLQTTLHEILNLKSQHVIELHARLIQHTDTHETANQCVTFKEPARLLFVEGEELTFTQSAKSTGSRVFRV
jgi:hypothetical protein